MVQPVGHWLGTFQDSLTTHPVSEVLCKDNGNAADLLKDHALGAEEGVEYDDKDLVDDVEDGHLGLHHLGIHLEHVHQHLLAEAHQHRGRLQYHNENLSAGKNRMIVIRKTFHCVGVAKEKIARGTLLRMVFPSLNKIKLL